MENLFIKFLFLLFTVNLSNAQAWMTNLDIAQRMASVENKMLLMVWEETTKYPYPVFVNGDKGTTIYVQNLFEDENLSPIIWKHFVPVIVNDDQYSDLYAEIKGKRTQKYIDKFNDDSIKIMDINGNILNVSGSSDNYQNITTLIQNYALNTKFVAPELKGYQKEKNFYSAYYLASKYIDFSMYMKAEIRSEVMDLATIYLNKSTEFIDENPSEDQLKLTQRVALLKIQQSLITKHPKKALRQLKRMDAKNVEINNQAFVAFLYYTVYRILSDETNAEQWESKISLVNLRKAQLIINLNS